MDRQGTTLCKHGTPTNKKCEICELMTDKIEEAFKAYWETRFGAFEFGHLIKKIFTSEYEFFKAGAAWQKEQTIGEVLKILKAKMTNSIQTDFETGASFLAPTSYIYADAIEEIKALSEGKG